MRMRAHVSGPSHRDGAFHSWARCSSRVSSFDPHNNPLREYELFLQPNKVRSGKADQVAQGNTGQFLVPLDSASSAPTSDAALILLLHL